MWRKRDIGCSNAALISRTLIRVRFSEVDSMHIVWHGEYVRYFEDGRESFGREFQGLGYMDIYRNGYTAPIVDLQLQYLSPLSVNETAIVETRYIDQPAAKICFEYIIRRECDCSIVARGTSVQVFVDIDHGEMSLNCPLFFKEWKRKWLGKI
jgi:acyl-CoA thioester hydrolase